MSYTHALGRVAELFQKVQQLERDNAALRADVLEQCTLNAKGSEREYSLRGRIEQLERENAALREDKEILDWMEKNVWAINFKYKPDVFSMDIREIIRDEIAKEDKP
jgi:hypothetical protein